MTVCDRRGRTAGPLVSDARDRQQNYPWLLFDFDLPFRTTQAYTLGDLPAQFISL
jgi:hypothetical protein